MNRMMIVSTMIYFVMQIPIFFIENIFLAMGQSKHVAFLAS